MSDPNKLTKQQVIDWLRATAADYVEDGEFARYLNAAAAMLADEPTADGGSMDPKEWVKRD